MASLPLNLIMEAMLAVLLFVTVIYCFMLDRRLKALRSGQDGLRDIIKALNAATNQAHSSIVQLKFAGEQTTGELKEWVEKARALTDELSLMVESGNGLADRLANPGSGRRASNAATNEIAGEDGFLNANSGSAETGPAALQSKLLKALREAR